MISHEAYVTLYVMHHGKPWWIPRFVWRYILKFVEVQIHRYSKMNIPWPPTKDDYDLVTKHLKEE